TWLAVAHRVRGVVVHERLLVRIPGEFAAEFHGNPSGGTSLQTARSLVDWRDGVLVGDNAVDPVEIMVRALRPTFRVGRERRKNFHVAGAERDFARVGGDIRITAGHAHRAAGE